MLPSIERLHEVYTLDHETGLLYNKARRPGVRVGAVVGTTSTGGYLRATVDGYVTRVHRIVWAMANGRWPEKEIDHENGVVTDNRPPNLREATRSQNTSNKKLMSTNTSGYRGVHWRKDTGKWRVTIMVNRKTIRLGNFTNITDAAAAYEAAAKEYFNEFYRPL